MTTPIYLIDTNDISYFFDSFGNVDLERGGRFLDTLQET